MYACYMNVYVRAEDEYYYCLLLLLLLDPVTGRNQYFGAEHAQ